jgi:DNA modification methylase
MIDSDLRNRSYPRRPYYEHAGITIYHGDCRELLPVLKGDLLCTDPPYGINVARRGTVGSGGRPFGSNRRRNFVAAKNYGPADWDKEPPAAWLFGLMCEKTQWQIIFGGNYFPLPPSRCWLVWDKDNSDNAFADCELAWTNFDKAVRKFKWRWSGMLQEDMTHKEFRVHPTQKPVALMKWAISQAPEDCKVILDPFIGSGSTLIAAKALGREAIGIEREEKYCEAAATRLSQEVLEFA